MAFVVPAGDPKYTNTVGKPLHWTVLYYPAANTVESKDMILELIKKTCIETLGTNIVRLAPRDLSTQWKNSVFMSGDPQTVMDAVYAAMAAKGMPVDEKLKRKAHVELRGASRVGGKLVPDPEIHLDRLWPEVDINTIHWMG